MTDMTGRYNGDMTEEGAYMERILYVTDLDGTLLKNDAQSLNPEIAGIGFGGYGGFIHGYSGDRI